MTNMYLKFIHQSFTEHNKILNQNLIAKAISNIVKISHHETAYVFKRVAFEKMLLLIDETDIALEFSAWLTEFVYCSDTIDDNIKTTSKSFINQIYKYINPEKLENYLFTHIC